MTHVGAWSANKSSRYAAGREARGRCGQPGCEVLISVHNGYAVVVEKADGVFVGATGKTKALALRRARNRALEPSAPLFMWVFSGY